jgi:phage tail protein X
MSFDKDTGLQHAAMAERGDLHSLGALLRALCNTALAYLFDVTPGTAAASKAVVLDANKGISGLGPITRAPVAATGASLTVTAAEHADRTVVLDRAAGIAVTLPDATGTGHKYRFVVKTTFTGAASIKSSRSADIMIGHALMGNDSDNSVVDWQSIAGSTNDTIDLYGTSNSTGGMAGQIIELEDIAENLWFVEIRGDAAGTEATPFANTVAP